MPILRVSYRTMSVSVAMVGEQSTVTQPFQCPICRKRFTRHENLKRHAALHKRSPDKASYSCELCAATFSRRDLCTRHMRRKHPDHEEEERPAKRCRPNSDAIPARTRRMHSQGTASTLGSLVESGSSWSPEQGDVETPADIVGAGRSLELTAGGQRSTLGHDYHRYSDSPDSPVSSAGTAPEHTHGVGGDMMTGARYMTAPPHMSPFTRRHVPAATSACHTHPSACLNIDTALSQTQMLLESFSPRDGRYWQDNWNPTMSQVERGLDLYFTYFSPCFPFLHRPTFDARESTGYLLLSILCLGYQYGEDPDCGLETDSGQFLSLRCFHRARVLLLIEERKEEGMWDGMSMVQAYLLLEVCAVMYLCGADSAYGLQMHPRMIALIRSSGLTQPPRPCSEEAKNLHDLWNKFRRAESRKRTLSAAHQIDALWYQLLSIPRSLSHLEIKLELPCAPDCWAASSAEAWAYLQITSPGYSLPSVQYCDAIRRFLSPEPDAKPLPPFDPFGAINIVQFLLSSAREVSGWSAITGRLSLERLDPLRSSLMDLAPYLRANASIADAEISHLTVAQEAFWQMAMIELRIWSPSHTCGIIEGSVDAMLRASARLAATSQISCGTQLSADAQPHIDWFLRYLDTTGAVQAEAEAPWTALYAFQAFLMAWQLFCKPVPGAMQAVGVADGDAVAALLWARKAFRWRSRRRVGKMIMECLDMLSA